MDYGQVFGTISEALRKSQRVAIAVENAPEDRKRLRRFSQPEVAQMLGISDTYLRSLVTKDGFPAGVVVGARRSFSFEEVVMARAWLHSHSGGNRRYSPNRSPEEKLAVVAFTNFKGGSGKTTTAVHFAQYMSRCGYRVLLVDLDAQGSATAQFGIDPATEVRVVNSFAGWVAREHNETGAKASAMAAIQRTYWPTIDLVPAGQVLHETEYSIALQLPSQSRPSDYRFYDELGSFLRMVGSAYDVVVVDCRPDVNMLTTNALHASTGLVMPVQASMIDIASFAEFLRFLASADRNIRRSLDPHGFAFDFVSILPTRFSARDNNQREALDVLNHHAGRIMLRVPMIETTIFVGSGNRKETIYEYEPEKDKRAYDRAIEALDQVNAAIEAQVLSAWGRPPLATSDLVAAD